MTQEHFIVKITRTSRPAGRNGEWRAYDFETHDFDSIAEARAWIKTEYDGHNRPLKTRKPMYIDTKSRGTIQTGWVFHGKITEGDRSRPNCWRTDYLQDWVGIARVTKEPREGKQGECESVAV